MVTKPNNSNCDKTDKLKLQQNSKTKIVTSLKSQIVRRKKLKHSRLYVTLKLKL